MRDGRNEGMPQDLVPFNPLLGVKVVGVKKDKRARTVLTDAEIDRYMSYPGGNLEVKLASLVARFEGGMRTAEVLRWDWSMIDTAGFATCTILRAKTGDVVHMAIPGTLAPWLRQWHSNAGSPSSGPVFPAVRGDRKGQAKRGKGYSYAKRLRRDLFRAGVVRFPVVAKSVTVDGVETIIHEPHPADPLYFDTTVSRKVDFHSFRRAYSGALAKAGLNLQSSMALTSHSEPSVHMGYVRELAAATVVPAEALPILTGDAATILAPPVPKAKTAKRETREKEARHRGFEPLTYGSGGRRSIQLS